MKKIIQGLDRHFEEWLLTFFLGMIAAIMLLQVIMRYMFCLLYTSPGCQRPDDHGLLY